MVTAQKRQELQMQLLKRARRRAQKKIEYLEDDKNWKEVKNTCVHGFLPDCLIVVAQIHLSSHSVFFVFSWTVVFCIHDVANSDCFFGLTQIFISC